MYSQQIQVMKFSKLFFQQYLAILSKKKKKKYTIWAEILKSRDTFTFYFLYYPYSIY